MGQKLDRGGSCVAGPPSQMSLLAWNFCRLGTPRTVRFLKEITHKKKPCFIFLSETFASKDRVEFIHKALRFTGCIVVESQSHGGGLALLWKNEGACHINKVDIHYIDFEVENDQIGRWRYTGFYGCPERIRRRESWSKIRSLATSSHLPWCIIGDFNDLTHADEKRGGRDHPYYLLNGFVKTIRDCQLIDLGFVGDKFMWERSRGTAKWIQERLDRGLATQEWINMFPKA